jgi:GTP cyclohydrolase I
MVEPNWNKIEKKQSELLQLLHEELSWFNSEELKNTPGRITRFYKEWNGLNNYKFTVFPAPPEGRKSLVTMTGINLHSACSHHFLVYSGVCHISYYPRKKLCGISKLARVVKHFASKPGVQENLTQEIADYLQEKLDPLFLMVYISASHSCMKIRGVNEANSTLTTNAIRWNKKNKLMQEVFEELKKETLSVIAMESKR